MNPERDPRPHELNERSTEPEPATDPASAESVVEKTETPDAVQAAKVAGRRGNERSKAVQGAVRRARGVEWVRPTDLIARHGGAAAARGIDFQVELARRTRIPIKAGVGHMSDRVRGLPPLSAFGRSTTQAGPSRPGVGMN